MKKYAIAAIVLTLGVSMAFAGTLGVPLFVDNAPVLAGVPSSTLNKVTGVVTLQNLTANDIECIISYYNLAGDALGPFGADATFNIAAHSSLGFRPVADDPAKGIPYRDSPGVATQNGGQEGAQGVLVPNRPTNVDPFKNGSITIEWVGTSNDIGGNVGYFQTSVASTGELATFSYAHLLPQGP